MVGWTDGWTDDRQIYRQVDRQIKKEIKANKYEKLMSDIYGSICLKNKDQVDLKETF